MTKWPVHKQTHRTTQKHIEHQDATDIQKHVFVFYLIFKSSYLGQNTTRLRRFRNQCTQGLCKHYILADRTFGFICSISRVLHRVQQSLLLGHVRNLRIRFVYIY